jgi:hypothetical protein
VATAMMNEIIYALPSWLKPFSKKLVVSILDWDIIYLSQLDKLGPSPVLRGITYDFFRLCGFLIREFGLPRLSPYKRAPDAPNSHVSNSSGCEYSFSNRNGRVYLSSAIHPMTRFHFTKPRAFGISGDTEL